MMKKNKIDAKWEKLTTELTKLYGDDLLVMGRNEDNNYLSLPDDPKTFGKLMERLLTFLLTKGLVNHLEEAAEAYVGVANTIKEGIEKLNAN